MNKGIRLFTSFFKQGNKRTLLIKRNILASFSIKILTVLISFVSYPLTLSYLNPTRSGIWLTLTSIISWILLFDIGLGNGLKNKLTEVFAKENVEIGKQYVSSTYALLGILLLIFIFFFMLLSPLIDWGGVLNAPPIYQEELKSLSQIVFCGFCSLFFLRLIISIITADQRPALGAFIDMLSQLCCLIGIIILTKTSNGSLINFGWVSSAVPTIVYIIASIILFRKRYNKISPSFHFISWNVAIKMVSLGSNFFIATLSSLVLFQTTNIFASKMIGNEAVTVYNTSLKIFNAGLNILAIIVYPYWAAYSNAFIMKDYKWMQQTYKSLLHLFLGFLLFESLLLLLSKWIYALWIKELITIPISVSVSVFFYTCSIAWITLITLPINGIGKLRLQVYSSIYEIVAIIPTAIFLGQQFGLNGIILAPIVISIPRMIWAPIQLYRLTQGTAKNIWNAK